MDGRRLAPLTPRRLRRWRSSQATRPWWRRNWPSELCRMPTLYERRRHCWRSRSPRSIAYPTLVWEAYRLGENGLARPRHTVNKQPTPTSPTVSAHFVKSLAPTMMSAVSPFLDQDSTHRAGGGLQPGCMESIPGDTGGEFTGWASAGERRAAKGSRTDAKADPVGSNAHEQTANSEFATSTPGFRVHTPRPQHSALQARSQQGLE